MSENPVGMSVSEPNMANAELQETKERLAVSDILASAGMVAATWRHSMQGSAITILDYISIIRKKLQDQKEVIKYLDSIEEIVRQMMDRPVNLPLLQREGITSIPINDLLQDRIRVLLMLDQYKEVEFVWKLSPDSISIRISPEWLKRVLDILIDNAVHAMSKSYQKIITIETRTRDKEVEILVSDTGTGISEDVTPHLFRQRIQKEADQRGIGIGLLKARFIVEAYGGSLRLLETGQKGTTFIITLPLAE